MASFDGLPYESDLIRRLDCIRRILEATHPSTLPPTLDISREARGLIILLLFASYESLLTSLCRGLLDFVATLQVGNAHLKKGLRIFASYSLLQSMRDSSESKIWKETGWRLVDTLSASTSTINSNLFPSDGSYMKSSQVVVFCELFDLGDPARILKEVWSRLDAIVTERNSIAHGKLTPEEVGRNYSRDDIERLITLWQNRWIEFIRHVSTCASSNNFFTMHP